MMRAYSFIFSSSINVSIMRWVLLNINRWSFYPEVTSHRGDMIERSSDELLPAWPVMRLHEKVIIGIHACECIHTLSLIHLTSVTLCLLSTFDPLKATLIKKSLFFLQAFSQRQKSLLSSWKQQAQKIWQPPSHKFDRRQKGYVGWLTSLLLVLDFHHKHSLVFVWVC